VKAGPLRITSAPADLDDHVSSGPWESTPKHSIAKFAHGHAGSRFDHTLLRRGHGILGTQVWYRYRCF